MIKPANVTCHCVAAILGCLAAPFSSTVAQVPLPPDIEQALEGNAKSISPITVTWERKRTSPVSVERVLSIVGLPETSTEFLTPEKVRFMWDHGKFYTYFWRSFPHVNPDLSFDLDAPMQTQEQEISCDGRNFYSGNPNSSEGKKIDDPIILIDTLDKIHATTPMRRVLTADYIYLAGIRMPQTASAIESREPVAHILDEMANGWLLSSSTTADIDGEVFAELEVAKGDQKQVFFLDPRRNYALRRRVTYSAAGDLVAQVNCSDFRQLPGTSVWLPARIATAMYFSAYGNTEPLIVEELVVSELSNEPIPDAQFALRYDDPGTMVADGTLPGASEKATGRVSYVVPADPDRLDSVIAIATGNMRARKVGIFIWINIVVLAVLGSVVLFRRLRR